MILAGNRLRVALLGSVAIMAGYGSPASAQANEAQSTANPAPAQPAADTAASVNPDNNAGQTSPQPQASDASDIVVTAQFRSQRLQDTPIAITAVSGAMLEARNQMSVIDIGQFSPNVNLSQASSLYGNSVSAFIRGVGQLDSSFALEPGVGIYIDDVYYGTTFGANLDLTDLDRVEVLRGPQGTLAGKNSVGGAVKLFSKKPDDVGGGYVEASYGRFNRVDVRGSADFVIADGLFARISGVEKHVDGFFKRLDFGCANPGQGIAPQPGANNGCVIGTSGGIDVQAVRVALRYAPTGSPLEVNLIGDVSIDRSESAPTKITYAQFPGVRSFVPGDATGGIPFDSRFITGRHSYSSYATFSNGGNYTTVFGFPRQVQPGTFRADPDANSKAYGFSGTIDYKLGEDLGLKSITAYRKASGTDGIDVDGSPLDILLQNFGQSHRQFTQELRLSGKFGKLVDFTVGGFYYKAHDLLTGRNEIPNVIFDFLSDDPVTNRSASAFTHVEVHPFEGFNIIGGLRYTDDKKVYTFGRRNIDGSPITGIPLTTNFLVAGLDGLKGTYKGNRVDYRLGVNYRFSPEVMAYAQVSTGFKGGGVNPRPYVAAQVLPFGPEKLRTYEIGAKADLLDRAVRLNGALFYNEYDGLQLTLYTCPETPGVACGRPANAGDAHVKGAEVEATVRPVRALTIDGSVGYLDFDYTRVNAATLIQKSFKAPLNAKWQASSGIQYALDLGGSGTLTPRFDWAYISSYFYNALNSPFNRVAARSVFNLRLAYESPDKKWTVSGNISNLFDKFYYVVQSENIANYGVASGVVGRPREWQVTVRRVF